MSLFNSYSVTVHRYLPGGYTGPGNSWVKGIEAPGSPFFAKGTWQPANGEDQQPLDEGKRSDSVMKFYTGTKLQIVNQKTQKPGDVLESPLDGQLYEVSAQGEYQNNLIPNYKYLCTRVKEA